MALASSISSTVTGEIPSDSSVVAEKAVQATLEKIYNDFSLRIPDSSSIQDLLSTVTETYETLCSRGAATHMSAVSSLCYLYCILRDPNFIYFVKVFFFSFPVRLCKGDTDTSRLQS